VRASDKRSVFVGLGAYEAAGGIVLRDLFEQDGGRSRTSRCSTA
jgi:ParB family transcriptional regulator, chromosome partitioning protein